MKTTKNVIIPGDLGNEFDWGTLEAQKVHIKLTNTLKRDALTGEIGVDPTGGFDFWNRNVGGAAKPDGTNDLVATISRSGKVGIGEQDLT